MRKALIFPGYPYSCEDNSYQKVVQIYRDQGFETVPAEIDWSRNLEGNLDKAEIIMQNFSEKNRDMHIFGHSWGAVCALWASRNISTSSLILASLSPEFREDRDNLNFNRQKIGNYIKQITDLVGKPVYPDERPLMERLSEMDADRVELLYGEREYRGWFGIRFTGFGSAVSDHRLKILPNSSEHIVRGSGHMLNESYLDTIKEKVREMS